MNKRNVKQSHVPSKKTLDIQHTSKVNEIQDIEEQQQNMKDKVKIINKEIDTLNELKRNANITDEQMETLIVLQDEKQDYQRQIEALSEQLNEIDYYVNVGHTLFKYYDIIEKGSNDDDNSNNHPIGDSILKYFVKSNSITENDEPATQTENRASLLDKYMSSIDRHYLPQNRVTEVDECCKYCSSKNMCLLWSDGLNYCQDCGSIEHVTVEHEKPSYHQSNTEITYFAYKRINHLNECISQIQGKETTDIPQEVYDMILLEIKKQKITNMAELTPKKLRSILKKLRLNRYYEHLIHLVNKLTGINIPHFDPEVEERLRIMFKMIQPAFLKHAPKNRKNFLSYNYTLRKCIQLLERDEYLHLFPALKSREKTFEQDKIWRKICEELNWEFIPSI
jgi:hypothetical protein